MRKFALMLILALFAAVTVAPIATMTPAYAADAKKDTKKKAEPKKVEAKKAAPKAKKRVKSKAGHCGAGKYVDKKHPNKCLDASAKK